ncbi:hypothetical protein BGW42_008441 [Actinomortierella wolfii]|nr:hypothetical protein BGW42_008441 [Actinomortierella wolfii]
MAGVQRRKKSSAKVVEQDVATSTSNALHKSGSKTSTAKVTSKGGKQQMDDEGSEFSEVSDGSESGSESDIDDIPDPEKWRLINESGILGRIPHSDRQSQDSDEDETDDSNRDYLFEGIFFSIPTTCLFVVMDILVHRQYGETYSGANIFRKIVKIFPGNIS